MLINISGINSSGPGALPALKDFTANIISSSVISELKIKFSISSSGSSISILSFESSSPSLANKFSKCVSQSALDIVQVSLEFLLLVRVFSLDQKDFESLMLDITGVKVNPWS